MPPVESAASGICVVADELGAEEIEGDAPVEIRDAWMALRGRGSLHAARPRFPISASCEGSRLG
jgi:hypothetical protein